MVKAKYYVSVCRVTGQVFICKVGVDGNLAMVFDHDGRTDYDNARKLVALLNRKGGK